MLTLPKKRSRVPFVLVAIAAIVIAIIAASQHATPKGIVGHQHHPPHRPPHHPPHGPAHTSGIGRVFKDGDFAFVVHSIICGPTAAAAVNPGGFGEKVPPSAKECLVTMTITNDRQVAQTLDYSAQSAYDSRGSQFTADTTGAIYMNNSQDGTSINPGISVSVQIPFQIPKRDVIASLQLHDSIFSNGVAVRIR
jgi:hypothetical protein